MNINNFYEWLKCMKDPEIDICYDQGARYYACYDRNLGCPDPHWYDCYWDGKCVVEREEKPITYE